MEKNISLETIDLLDEFILSTEAKELVRIELAKTKNLYFLQNYNFDKRYICDKTGQVYLLKNIISGFVYGFPMSAFLTRDGYVEYVLTSKYGKKHIQGHRIVAGLFLPFIKGKEYVNHKDGNRSNNEVSNLEWVSASENIKHSWNYLRKR